MLSDHQRRLQLDLDYAYDKMQESFDPNCLKYEVGPGGLVMISEVKELSEEYKLWMELYYSLLEEFDNNDYNWAEE